MPLRLSGRGRLRISLKNADKQRTRWSNAKRAAGDLLKWSAARMAGKDGWTDKVTIEHEGQGSFIEALKKKHARRFARTTRARQRTGVSERQGITALKLVVIGRR